MTPKTITSRYSKAVLYVTKQTVMKGASDTQDLLQCTPNIHKQPLENVCLQSSPMHLTLPPWTWLWKVHFYYYTDKHLSKTRSSGPRTISVTVRRLYPKHWVEQIHATTHTKVSTFEVRLHSHYCSPMFYRPCLRRPFFCKQTYPWKGTVHEKYGLLYQC